MSGDWLCVTLFYFEVQFPLILKKASREFRYRAVFSVMNHNTDPCKFFSQGNATVKRKTFQFWLCRNEENILYKKQKKGIFALPGSDKANCEGLSCDRYRAWMAAIWGWVKPYADDGSCPGPVWIIAELPTENRTCLIYLQVVTS